MIYIKNEYSYSSCIINIIQARIQIKAIEASNNAYLQYTQNN